MESVSKRISSLLLGSIVVNQLEEFLKQHELPYSGNVTKKLDTIYEAMDSNEEIKDDFKNFLCNQAKYTNNRVVITTPIKITMSSPLRDIFAFKKKFPNYLNFNNIAVFEDDELKTLFEEDKYEFLQVYENIDVDGERIESISKAFAKLKVQNINDELTGETIVRNHLEFVWIDVFPQERYYRIYLSEPLNNTNGQLSKESSYEKFSKMIEDLYSCTPTAHSSGNVLYKIYKNLTDVAESPYVERVEAFYEDIDKFVEDVSNKLEYSDQGYNSISLNTRVKKLLERAIIQQDFKFYSETTTDREGFVEKFQYQDPTGGRVQASTNGDTYDMSKHDIYFDTKETIAINKILNVLWVKWYKPEFVNGERVIKQIKIRYESHSKYYITHFLYNKVTREDCEYVLPKFDEYEKK